MSQEVSDPDELSVVEIDHSPTVASSGAAVAAGTIAALASAPFALLALPLGFGGIAILAAGLFVSESRTMVSIGTVGLFLSVIVAGGFGTPVEFLLIGMAGTLVAWDLGQHAIDLGEQIGRQSKTTRNEAIHASISVLVAVLAASIGYAVYYSAGGGRPVAALTAVLVGVVLLLWAIRT